MKSYGWHRLTEINSKVRRLANPKALVKSGTQENHLAGIGTTKTSKRLPFAIFEVFVVQLFQHS
jgi:hypothetical protein